MSGDLAMARWDVVRHNLALGLEFRDAAGDEPLVAPLRAVIERIGPRQLALPMLAKAAGAALRLDAGLGRRFQGLGGPTVPVQILVTPALGLGLSGRRPPDRSVIARRIRLALAVDAQGLPRAEGPAPEGKWVFPVRLHRGVSFPRGPGETALTGSLMQADPAGGAPLPCRWAHVVARHGSDAGAVLGTARCDDRGEFILRLQKRVGQTPNRLREILVKLQFHIAPQPVPAGRVLSHDDVPVENLVLPDTSIDLPPAGYLARPGPLTALWPGSVETLPMTVLS